MKAVMLYAAVALFCSGCASSPVMQESNLLCFPITSSVSLTPEQTLARRAVYTRMQRTANDLAHNWDLYSEEEKEEIIFEAKGILERFRRNNPDQEEYCDACLADFRRLENRLQ